MGFDEQSLTTKGLPIFLWIQYSLRFLLPELLMVVPIFDNQAMARNH